MLDFPNTPTVNQIFSFWQWDGVKWLTATFIGPSMNAVPIAFPFTGKPASGMIVNVPMSMPLAVPAGLSGTNVFASSLAAAGAIFTVNKVSANVTTLLGTVTVTPVSHTSASLSGPGGSLAVGDDLQVVAPTQDANLADVGVTILLTRL